MKIISSLNSNYWLRSGSINLLQNALTLVISFGSFYFLIRTLDKTDFGVWVLFMSAVSIMEFARTGLISKSLITYLSSAPSNAHNSIITASFTINLSLTLVLAAACHLLAPLFGKLWNSSQLVPLFNLYIVTFVISGFLVQYQAIEQAQLQFKGVFLSNLIRQLTLLAFILYTYFNDRHTSLIALVQVMTAGTLAATLVSRYFARGTFRLWRKLDKYWLKQLLQYGKYSFGTSMTAVVSSSIDQMMIGGLVSATSAGIYNIAVRVTNMINIPTNAVATIVFPQSARRLEDGGNDAVKALYEKSVGAVLAMLFPAIVIAFLFAGPVIHFIGDDRYPESIPLLQITLLSAFFMPFTKQFGTILDSIGRVKLNFYITVVSVALNALLNYLFIRHWGIVGAAVAMLISYLILFITTQLTLKKILGVRTSATLVYAFKSYGEVYNKLRHRAI